MWLLFTTLSIISTLSGVAITKFWIQNHKPSFFALAFGFYFLSSLLYMQALRFERITIVEAFWGAGALILTIVMGLFLFHEKVSPQESTALALAIIATLLLLIKL